MAGTILYFLEDPSRDKHFHDYVLTGLENAGYNPIVTYFFMDGMKSTMAAKGHRVIDLGCTCETYKGFHPGLVAKICRAIKKYDARAIHSQRHHPLIYMAAASALTGCKVFFYTIRSLRLIRTLNRRLSFPISASRITKVIAVSRGAKEDFVISSGISEDKVEVIHNGIDPQVFDLQINKKDARRYVQLPAKPFLFGMAARFTKAKDHPGLIDAYASLKAKGVDSLLVLAGDGPLEKKIKGLVESKNLQKDVVFMGKITPDEIPVFLKALDVFVHPSIREGFGASIVEAMASGLPVIASDAGGVSDIFDTPRVFGRMLPKEDVDLLAGAMEEFYNITPEERQKMGSLAQARVFEAFTHKHMVDKTVALYDQFIGQTL